MRLLTFAAALLVALLCSLPCQAQSASEIYFDEAVDEAPWTSDTFIEEEIGQEQGWGWRVPNPSQHTGLLGKVFMQQRYLQLGIDDPDVRQIDKSLQGFDSLINLPLMTLESEVPLDFDLFFGYSNVGLKGSAPTGPPLDLLVTVNGKSESYTLGTSIYFTQAERWRPFVQLGVEYSEADFDLAIKSAVDTYAENFVDGNTELLFNAGFEYDLLDVLGYRMTIDCETTGRFRDSLLLNDLILWPHEKIFIRGGLATSLEGGGLGFAIGGGLTF